MSMSEQLDMGMEAPAASLAMPSDYVALLKPRVMSLVVFTALVGLVLAPADPHPFMALVAIVCIAVGAGASGALNMWVDADIDGLMARTRTRPVPAGRVTADGAFAFGLVLAALSVMTMGVLVGYLAAALLAFTIFFYAVVYSMWLKRSTPQNIVIGGAAGAFPPVIGWAAATGSISLEPLVLFAIIFLWTPPHFWALALVRAHDYERAGIPMMPNVAGERSTRRQILIYAALVALAGVAPWPLGFASAVYGIAAIGLGAVFFAYAIVLWQAGAERLRAAAKKLFAYSVFYLFALFAILLGEAVWSGMVW